MQPYHLFQKLLNVFTHLAATQRREMALVFAELLSDLVAQVWNIH
jgi:hypothetical protein